MKVGPAFNWRLAVLSWLLAAAAAQVTPANPPASTASPVPYASISQLNLMLSQLEQASQAMQVDLAKLRIERWKADGNTKRGAQTDVESIERNLQSALPEIISQLRSSPDSLPATFKLYRNLDALYDVFGSVAESAGAFGSRDEYQSLQNDLNELERSRKSFADRMDTLSNTKEQEVMQLRTELRNAQAAVNTAAPPKKQVVDDTEPAKPVKKKLPAKSTKKPTSSATQQKPSTPPAAPPQSQPQ